MVKSIYFLKPAWCGIHLAGLWPEQGLQPVTRATALQAVVFTATVQSGGSKQDDEVCAGVNIGLYDLLKVAAGYAFVVEEYIETVLGQILENRQGPGNV
jgi:hypothetical protein